MGCELDQAMWEAWQKIESKVLGNEIELRRRLDRRTKTFERVPRALCIAIRAADRRITPVDVLISPPYATTKGQELEHDVLLTSSLVKELCRPVRLTAPGEPVTDLQRYLGCSFRVARHMGYRGVAAMRGIKLLGGRRGYPVPVAYSRFPLDPCARGKTAPDALLQPYWQDLASRMPFDVEQLLRRKPIFYTIAGRRRLVGWTWVCPGCKRDATTVYFPLGGPNWAALHNIKLPEGDWYDPPQQSLCFACHRCHHTFGISRTPKSIAGSWASLVTHMSGGLLYGREVKRPASFCLEMKNKSWAPIHRPSPRFDEFEAYLANTDLPLDEIARRMGWTYPSAITTLYTIYRKRGLSKDRGAEARRQAIKHWWTKNRPAPGQLGAAA